MRIPTLLFFSSAAVAAWSALNASAATDLSLLAGVSALAALILVMRNEDEGGQGAGHTPSSPTVRPVRPVRRKPTRRRSAQKQIVLIDGSNVLYWQAGEPSLDTLKLVIKTVKAEGLVPLVGFDANVGYVVCDGWRDARAMARMLGLPGDQVSVAPKGTPADPLLIAEALRLDAPIITNDRYRDWHGTWPQIAAQGFLIRGGYHEGRFWLDLPEPEFMPQGFALAA